MMSGTNGKPKRLAPAGRRDRLEAVIAAGADAVSRRDGDRQRMRT